MLTPILFPITFGLVKNLAAVNYFSISWTCPIKSR